MDCTIPKCSIHDLSNFSVTLNTIEDLDETLACVVEFTMKALNCDRVSIMLLDGDVLRIRAAAGLSDDVIETTRIPIGERVSGEVFRSGQAVLVKNVDALPYVERNVDLSSKSFMSSPILYAGLASPSQPLGIINVTERDGGLPFAEEDLELLTLIANTASIAMHNQIARTRLESACAEAKAQADQLKAQADQLAEANERLQILQRLKGDFLTFIAHELRSPLTALTAIDLIGKCSDPKDLSEVVEILRSGYVRLEGFITKALDYFEWVGTGKVLTSEATDLGAIVRAVANDIPGLKEPGVDFHVTCPDGPAPVRAAAGDLTKVVRILLENALKFSPEEKSIHAEVQATPESVTLRVSDRGVGFPARWSQEIFRPFTMVDLMNHRRGTALHLATAKAILEAFGGSIRAESAGIGKGACFIIQLPSAMKGTESSPRDNARVGFSLKVSR